MRHNVYSVGQVNTYIKNMFGQDYLLSRLYVRGEVSNCKYHTSGHIYFSLKDANSKINCIMFKNKSFELDIVLKEGMSVIVSGRASAQDPPGRAGRYLFCLAGLQRPGSFQRRAG